MKSLFNIIIRWIKFPLLREYEWTRNKTYRYVVRIIGKIRFNIQKRIDRRVRKNYDLKFSNKILRLLLKTIIPAIAISFLFIIVFEFIGYLIPINIEIIVTDVNSILPNHTIVLDNNVDYKDLFGIYSQISVIILGLFFAAVTTVLSKTYSEVSDEIREKFLKDRWYILYISISTLFGGISIFSLLISYVGYQVNMYIVFITTFLCLLSLFGFVPTVRRTFMFFNPVNMFEGITGDIGRWIQGVTPKRSNWKDSRFQEFYRRKTETDLNILKNITDIAIRKPHLQGKSLSDITLHLLSLLLSYTKEKLKIPSDSYWFERVPNFRDWLTAGESEITIAMQTSTVLQPKYEPNRTWFEDRISLEIIKNLKTRISDHEFRKSAEILNDIRIDAKEISYYYETKTALSFLGLINEFIIPSLDEGVDKFVNRDSELHKLAVIESYGYIYINILLGFFESLNRDSIINFDEKVSSIDWGDNRQIYLRELPRKVVMELEVLYDQINYEMKMEKRVLTTNWYNVQMAAIGLHNYYTESISTLLDSLENDILRVVGILNKKQEYRKTADLARIGLEACSKFNTHLAKNERTLLSINDYKIEENRDWNLLDLNKYYDRISIIREKFLSFLANSTESLFEASRDKSLPDYFGQNYCYLAEECLSALEEGNEVLFRKIYSAYFHSTFVAFERLQHEYSDIKKVFFLRTISQPILDLIDILGYSVLYSELDDKNFKETIEEEWGRFLELDDNKFLYSICVIISGYNKYDIYTAFASRELVRTRWNQKFFRTLRERGLIIDRHFNTLSDDDTVIESCKSPIIRTIIGKNTNYLEQDIAKTVFAGLYLKEKMDDYELEVPSDVETFLRDYDKEISR